MQFKETWYLILESDGKIGIGECGLLRGLSYDDRPDYESKLLWTCQNIHRGLAALYPELQAFPSIQFGLEQAFLSLESEHPGLLFPSDFTRGTQGIPINGLLWMAPPSEIESQFVQKIAADFRCVKMKVGANDLQAELDLLRRFRAELSPEQLEIRLDANGAYTPENVGAVLEQFAPFGIHSIEQPIRAGQWEAMREVCATSPIPIALDEELIGVFEKSQKQQLLATIAPHYIILKPSFVGGFQGAAEWIDEAKQRGIGWWVTSALESNVGLNAIAQWTYTLQNPMPQGLGTGALYANNIQAPLEVAATQLWYRLDTPWDWSMFK
jgi:o-succinylbenzoate synthase